MSARRGVSTGSTARDVGSTARDVGSTARDVGSTAGGADAVTPAPAATDAALALLHDDLAAARYTVDGVAELFGPVATAALHREQAVPARLAVEAAVRGRAPSSWDPRATLSRLFLLGGEVPRSALDAALPATRADGLVRAGLAVAAGQGDDDAVRAAVDLAPYAATDGGGGGPAEDIVWWLASDLGELARGGAIATDHVLGAGGASLTLAQVTVRNQTGRVLDLGTGCGIQALHAHRHAAAVVGTDISARALAFARFNAGLNLGDADAFDLRRGSMLEPVAGEQFDLVVSNPPFVITPHSGAAGRAVHDALGDFEYRDGGRAGDDLVRDLIQGVGAVLAPGGTAQLLGNWEHRRGIPWTERVGEWLDASGLDGWVIQREVLDPAEYAETWIRDGGTTPERDPAGWAAAYGAWLDDFASRDVEAIGFGIVTLRKPEGPATLRRLEEHTGSVHQPLGAHLAASLAAHAWLAARTDDDLLAAHLETAPDVTEERYLTPGLPDPNVVVIRQGDGLGRGVHASTALAALVGACDGELAVGQIAGAIAALFDVDAGALRAELLPAVRGLVRDGFLRPA
ncbi:methyltransferase small [Xylanimonas cellulosilytica DSM 15894]|uniref:Methyltransferase small n=1 Tax=Xylanimonas cellulosilytica (strain DSM 15894 / JCM 12276 / CECT 5975 / KCTC 9989 / LMG 20990 / NBRC 107835 / XIL07) TaxID=446471 RepID=D1BVB0_XYLCX|nr:methyltransferase [Xylanimonas cellulosilytica]ACZ29381.1 methyltransferase small [Xylanimonas cellulosilytica DSM 15894]